MRVRITKQAIENAAFDVILEHTPIILRDLELRGFAVRVGPKNTKNPTGKISYFVQQRTAGRGSREFRYVFGDSPMMDIKEARNKALSLIADIRANGNPAKLRKDTIELR